MVEQLLSYATLLSVGLMSVKEYNNILDELFLEMPEDSLLLDLEFVSSDISETISIINDYCLKRSVDYDVFGRSLMNALKKTYHEYGSNIENYTSAIYTLWGTLPLSIRSNEPFHTMCYAGDPLSWGDEKQSRELCEEMLHYYDKR